MLTVLTVLTAYLVEVLVNANILFVITNCTELSQCESYIIDCPLNHAGYLTCTRYEACFNMIINWNEDQDHLVLCGAYDWGCFGVNSMDN